MSSPITHSSNTQNDLLRTSPHMPGAGESKVSRSHPEPYHPGSKEHMKTDEFEHNGGGAMPGTEQSTVGAFNDQ
jgi:hypothetical protein